MLSISGTFSHEVQLLPFRIRFSSKKPTVITWAISEQQLYHGDHAGVSYLFFSYRAPPRFTTYVGHLSKPIKIQYFKVRIT